MPPPLAAVPNAVALADTDRLPYPSPSAIALPAAFPDVTDLAAANVGSNQRPRDYSPLNSTANPDISARATWEEPQIKACRYRPRRCYRS